MDKHEFSMGELASMEDRIVGETVPAMHIKCKWVCNNFNKNAGNTYESPVFTAFQYRYRLVLQSKIQIHKRFSRNFHDLILMIEFLDPYRDVAYVWKACMLNNRKGSVTNLLHNKDNSLRQQFREDIDIDVHDFIKLHNKIDDYLALGNSLHFIAHIGVKYEGSRIQYYGAQKNFFNLTKEDLETPCNDSQFQDVKMINSTMKMSFDICKDDGFKKYPKKFTIDEKTGFHFCIAKTNEYFPESLKIKFNWPKNPWFHFLEAFVLNKSGQLEFVECSSDGDVLSIDFKEFYSKFKKDPGSYLMKNNSLTVICHLITCGQEMGTLERHLEGHCTTWTEGSWFLKLRIILMYMFPVAWFFSFMFKRQD